MDAGKSSYEVVNSTINSVVLDGRFASRPLYLDIEGGVLRAIAEAFGVSESQVESLIAAGVSESLDFDSANPFEWHERRHRSWWLGGRETDPPFIALLCACSLAAENMRQDTDFSSTNYYERFLELLEIEDEEEKLKIRRYFKVTRKYWEAFNYYLNENEGKLGRPTASQVISHWTYVSYPISQALVREADRSRLHSMFEDFGLVPGERLSSIEMTDYLLQWIGSSGSSSWLRTLWANADLHEKIAQTAVFELESWEGSDEQDPSAGSRKRVILFGQPAGWPKASLRLMLGVSNAETGIGKIFRVPGGASPISNLAFKKCEKGPSLSFSPYDDVFAIDPAHQIELSPALAVGFELESSDGELQLFRHGRSIIPLALSEIGTAFREVTRVSLLGEHIVLCHQSWFPRVQIHLTKYAREGLKCFEPGSLPGIPNDWAAFLKVELIQAPDEDVNDNLQCITPLAETSLAVGPGLHLANQDWHAKSPIELVGVTGSGEAAIEIVKSDFLSDKDDVLASAKGSGCATLHLGGGQIPAGNYEIKLKRNGRLSQCRGINFADACNPRRKAAISSSDLFYRPSVENPFGTLSAQEDPDPEKWVSGMLLDPLSQVTGSTAGYEIAGLEFASNYHEDVDTEIAYGTESLSGFKEACAIKGYHVWKCEPFRQGEVARRPMMMTCSDCGERVLTKNRGKQKKKKKKGTVSRKKLQERISLQAAESKPTFGHDNLFDGMCYLGGGNAARLMRLASMAGLEPWAGHEFTRHLIALGHIDLEIDLHTLRPKKWWIAPPCVVISPSDKAFLSGYRSSEFLSEVSERISPLGGVLKTVKQDSAPMAIFIEGLNPRDLDRILDGLCDPFDRPLSVIETPALGIAQLCRPTSEIISKRDETFAIDLSDVEKFEPRSGRWRQAASAVEPGGYRTKGFGKILFAADSNGCFRTVPYTVLKVYAARIEGVRLHGADERSSGFISMIGCPPAGLLERALCSCSGLAPELVDGKLYYRDVPSDVSKTVIQRLYT